MDGMEAGTDIRTHTYTDSEREEEEKRLRRLQRIVGLCLSLIAQSSISVEEAERLAAGARSHALRLFPGKEATFEMIYAPRFRRLIAEKFGLH